MEDRITITLDAYLAQGYTIPDNIDKFLTLDLAGTEYNIRDLFVKRNLYKEIGSETEELFKHNLDVLIDESLSLYNPQLKLLQDNFNSLMSRKVTELSSGSASGSGNVDDTSLSYLNPANADSAKVSDKNTYSKTASDSRSFSESRERVFGFFKSNPDILKTANECFDVVLKILYHLDKAFIGEY